MTLDEFKATRHAAAPPAGTSELLLALWHDGRNDWEQAHRVAQEIDTAAGARVHAYLHRKEGDASNAAYWYRRAETSICQTTLEEEWEQLASEFLG